MTAQVEVDIDEVAKAMVVATPDALLRLADWYARPTSSAKRIHIEGDCNWCGFDGKHEAVATDVGQPCMCCASKVLRRYRI